MSLRLTTDRTTISTRIAPNVLSDVSTSTSLAPEPSTSPTLAGLTFTTAPLSAGTSLQSSHNPSHPTSTTTIASAGEVLHTAAANDSEAVSPQPLEEIISVAIEIELDGPEYSTSTGDPSPTKSVEGAGISVGAGGPSTCSPSITTVGTASAPATHTVHAIGIGDVSSVRTG